MYEYEMMNRKTNEIRFLFSCRSLAYAMEKAGMTTDEWDCVCRDYVD